jgi:hypothetical protein
VLFSCFMKGERDCQTRRRCNARESRAGEWVRVLRLGVVQRVVRCRQRTTERRERGLRTRILHTEPCMKVPSRYGCNACAPPPLGPDSGRNRRAPQTHTVVHRPRSAERLIDETVAPFLSFVAFQATRQSLCPRH